MTDRDEGDFEVYGCAPRNRRVLKSVAIYATLLLLACGTFFAGNSLNRWKGGRRVDTLAGAYALAPDGTFDERTKAIVAMQREALTIIELTQMMECDEDDRIAESAQNTLQVIDDALHAPHPKKKR